MESNLPINLKVSGSMYSLICNQINSSMRKEVSCGKHKKKLIESKSKVCNIPHLISNQLNLCHFPRRSTQSFGKYRGLSVTRKQREPQKILRTWKQPQCKEHNESNGCAHKYINEIKLWIYRT